ncbi:hypothetical protein BUE93_21370 [Chromobacterium amazonense]|uniref:Uncharacterized protein n=1 Tax=Chromobacterium amazonense TaxID=1382803 RepID=A0A2S9WYQ6_9NEIS|nr:hypothetical protein [Chromobacterium amazonense]PRP68594.1 hypothetical protein BUE93_21370 [Chromobacterium amazonense]
MAQSYRDPTFDEVARREEADIRHAAWIAERARRAEEKRTDPQYRLIRRRRIRRLMKQVLRGR